MRSVELTGHGRVASERDPTFPAADYSVDMLQRTMSPDPWPDRLDYLAVARIARDIRNQHIASLLGRAKHALAEWLAVRARATCSPSR